MDGLPKVERKGPTLKLVRNNEKLLNHAYVLLAHMHCDPDSGGD